MLINFRTFQTFFYKEYFNPFTLLFIPRKLIHHLHKCLGFKGFVWLPIIETIYPSNLRTSQPVDDLGGIHLLIVMIAGYQNSIQIIVAHQILWAVLETPLLTSRDFPILRSVVKFECF